MDDERKVGAVLVVGGGIGGIQASLDLAEQGFKVHLLEKNPSIGGIMAQLDKTFPTNDCAMCILAPKLVDCGRHPNIELIVGAELEGVGGEIGDFRVRVRRRASFVDKEKCVGCGACSQKCPVKVLDTFNEALSERRAIYVEYPQAVPLSYTIDIAHCLYHTKGKCRVCEKVCERGAINFEDRDEVIELQVGSIILAPGFDIFDARVKSEYGYGRYPNVITSLQFERILSASGPFQGHLRRLSDTREPERIAFIQCVGSRDTKVGAPYCSSVCCTYAVKEAIIANEHSKNGLETVIFYMDMRTFGKGFDEYYKRARDEYGVKFVRARVGEVQEDHETKNLKVRYVDETGDVKTSEFDLVVLCVGLRPREEAKEISDRLGIEMTSYRFPQTSPFSPIETARPGIFVAGAFQAPMDIPETISQSLGAAGATAELLSSARGTVVAKRVYPSEMDVSGQEPRIGVFICHCGINIAGWIDVEAIEEYAMGLPGVVYVERNLFTCSQDTQRRIVECIENNRLNRVVVASCSPRTHEPLFQETLREAGLNPYLFEMANIRDQCSWVHMKERDRATEKAKVLTRMAIAKVTQHEALSRQCSPVTKAALVVGGGVSGMVSALCLAKQRFQVFLVECEGELGGNLRHIHYTFDGGDPQDYLRSLIRKVEAQDGITIYKNARLQGFSGYVGNYKTKLSIQDKDELEIRHGVLILATGGVEYKPTGEYMYGEDGRVVTQRELEEEIASRRPRIGRLRSVVMIQCVGSRNEDRPYCSRYCCGEAVKNAVRLKDICPELEIYILYKDVRTYGFLEGHYNEARKRGVVFIRYDDSCVPEVSRREEGLEVKVFDPILQEAILIRCDLLVLSTALLPHPSNKVLAALFKVPLTTDGFFQEAHPKLRPVDFSSDGIFLAGVCHSPKMLDGAISQALAAASRAGTILSKDEIEAEGVVAVVDPDGCAACLTCIRSCPYDVPFINEQGIAEIEPVKCHGCGTCAGVCPGKAIELQNYKDKQILAKCEALFD